MSAIITLDQLKETTPSVFATEPSGKVSDRYSFVPTFELLEKFMDEGWVISSGNQMGKGLHGRHQIRLRNGELPQVGDTLVEAVINNSHNGTSLFSVSAGLHRLVCSNGLTVPTSISEAFKLRHTSIDGSEVRKFTEEFAGRLPMIEASVEVVAASVPSNGSSKETFEKQGSVVVGIFVGFSPIIDPALSVANTAEISVTKRSADAYILTPAYATNIGLFNTIFVGDIYTTNWHPTFYAGGVAGFVAAVDAILNLGDENSVIVPGHGEPSDKQRLKLFRQNTLQWVAQVQVLSEQGLTVSEIKDHAEIQRILRKFNPENNADFIPPPAVARFIERTLTVIEKEI